MNNIEKIKDALSKKKISGWQIREIETTSFQSFIAKEERECIRDVESLIYNVSLFQKRNQNGKDVLGTSTFEVGPGGLSEIGKQIDDALFAANLVSNQPFELPEKGQVYPPVKIFDETLNQKTLDRFEDRIRHAVSKEKGTRLSTTEFFIDRKRTRLVNHKELDVEQESTRIQTEFILLSKDGSTEKEFINRYTRRFESDFKLEEEVAQSAQFARDATRAVLPETGQFPALFSDETLDRLFEPLVAAASARLKYNKMVNVELGSSVVKTDQVNGDQITLLSNGLFRGGMGSRKFDSFGTPAQRVPLIENNILKSYLSNKQYADYLSIPVSGELGNIEILGGMTPFEILRDPSTLGEKKIYHIQAFSAFEPNPITGAFSAEIRSGYEITLSGVRPIKGGSVSGILQVALQGCLLSKKTVERESFYGPQGVLFKSLTFAGN